MLIDCKYSPISVKQNLETEAEADMAVSEFTVMLQCSRSLNSM